MTVACSGCRSVSKAPPSVRSSVWLPDYHAVIDAKPLPGMEKDEASDVTYDPQTKTLFSVMGKNPFLVELTLAGRCAAQNAAGGLEQS